MITIIVPVFNEESTIKEILVKILKLKVKKQIIIVDDASNDGTMKKIIKVKKKYKNILLIKHKKNLGKGAAIKNAQKFIKGKITIIQDADLEYDPNDYLKLIKPIKQNKTLVVYGSRFLNKKFKQNKIFTSNFRVFANILLTKISNIINNQKLTDAHTCYKVFESKLFKSLKLKEQDLDFVQRSQLKLQIEK